MSTLQWKERFIRALPGRIRTEVYGLQNNQLAADAILAQISGLEGVITVEASIETGRMLVSYDDKKISAIAIFEAILSIEERVFQEHMDQKEDTAFESETKPLPQPIDYEEQEIAASGEKAEHYGARSAWSHHMYAIPERFSAIPIVPKEKGSADSVPVPLLLSIGGLCVLGMKQLWFGKSVIARSSGAFYASALVSVVTGYPFLKRGFQQVSQKQKWNGDLLLGASALALGLLRENLVVLGGLGILQYMNWKRSKIDLHQTGQAASTCSKEVQQYSERMSKWGMLLGGAAFLVTRNPLYGLGILLAANPRPAMITEEFTWKQAELASKEHGLYVPEKTSLSRLARTNTILFEDTAQIVAQEKKHEVVTSDFSLLQERLFKDLHSDWKIGVLSNRQNIKDETLEALGVDHSWTTYTEEQIIERIEGLRQRGGEVLLISSAKHLFPRRFGNLELPEIPMQKMKDIFPTREYASQMEGIVRQNFMFSKQWNKLGLALSIPLFVTAPIINILADSVTLILLSKTKQASEEILHQNQTSKVSSAMQEAAAASDSLVSPQWHALSSEDVLTRFQVYEQDGLTSEQAQMIRNCHGSNRLETRQTIPWFVSFFGQFKEFTPLLLLGAAGLAIATGGLADGLVMTVVLAANAVLSTTQERKAEKIVESLNQFHPLTCKGIRDGREIELSSVELVPGDLVSVEAGDRVPADIRIIRAWNLEVNEAPLTGESLPVQKTDRSVAVDSTLSERNNMLYMGTDVTRGKGLGVVVATGMQTEMGHVMSLMKGEIRELTPLQKKVSAVGKSFVKGAMLAGGIVFLTGLLRGVSVTQMVMTTITLVASAVPEGLPVTITIALSAGIFRMARRNALIRRLAALETLGRTTVICSDKTGTLTKNEMTVKTIATVNRSWLVIGDGYQPNGRIEEITADEVSATAEAIRKTTGKTGRLMYGKADLQQLELQQIVTIGVLCNNSQLEQQDGKWMVKGDPTEGALLTLAAKTGVWKADVSHWTRCHEIPFDSNTGTMSVVCQNTQTDADCSVFLKGSVEAVLAACSWYQKDGNIYPLTDDKKEGIFKQNEMYAADALRVLGFAYKSIPFDQANQEGSNVDREDFIYVGLVGMIDPPKPEIETSIREAFDLGVQPIMITGDHPITAIAIAKQLGIWDGKKQVITGVELDRLSEEELTAMVEDVAIFARVTPEHKLRIVTAFQNRGHIVAMTGDGVNDTPAIKKANVGIAMGQMGTDVTKETADMVLKEDHFGSIVEGVKEGRTIIGNIRKAVGCLLTGNLAEILVTSVAVIAGMPIPLIPIQIMLMNLLTDALPAMVLAVNPGNEAVETKRQDIVDRDLYQKVVTRGVLLSAGSLGLFAVSLQAGASIAVAQTVAFATLVVGQLVQIFSWRQEGTTVPVKHWTQDKYLLGAVGFSALALVAALYVPSFARIFHTTPLSFGHWAMILAAAGTVHIVSKPIQQWLTNRNEIMQTEKPLFARLRPLAIGVAG
ncbi:HAD-IC family P-type ATPase [Fodinisporobacter ferrooxydans]|uniref:HAD-IC family P-type ATPase n=1 Tax=Fodinisporobacter ferrooxydans TaxID=2901836 RepID=A0ABY4CJE3_9BACL|nr:HAD-IC family P-type ATPase [Alicyclobacillaceae bacterium MYW30-H2]